MMGSSKDDEHFSVERLEFGHQKAQAMSKLDKSSAGRIDPRAVSICAAINANEEMYTTSSCAGRCFLWRGEGIKATELFSRGRISHEQIQVGYFLDDDASEVEGFQKAPLCQIHDESEELWLRFEPFILHTRCRTLEIARSLAAAARTAFKTVGLNASRGSWLVAIAGDEGLEMPLRGPTGHCLFRGSEAQWLTQLVNVRHERNWAKIERFLTAIVAVTANNVLSGDEDTVTPRYELIGDVAILKRGEPRPSNETLSEIIGKKRKHHGIRVVVQHAPEDQAQLGDDSHRGRRQHFVQLSGPRRDPLMTTHIESGIPYIVDLNRVFFSPRLALERSRLCRCVGRNDRVLVLFAGCGPEALAICARTQAASVIAVDSNPVAIQCCRRGQQALAKTKPNAAAKLSIIHSDVLTFLSSCQESFDRILAPRPKHPSLDGDRCPSLDTLKEDKSLEDFGGPGGHRFLDAILPRLQPGSGECHWYDFAADHELTEGCPRSKDFIQAACDRAALSARITYVGRAGPPVAKRQLRICVDFVLLSPRSVPVNETTTKQSPPLRAQDDSSLSET